MPGDVAGSGRHAMPWHASLSSAKSFGLDSKCQMRKYRALCVAARIKTATIHMQSACLTNAVYGGVCALDLHLFLPDLW